MSLNRFFSRALWIGCTLAGWAFLQAWFAPVVAVAQAVEAPLCRLGINSALPNGQAITAVDTAALRLGWYIDYRALETPARPNGIEYAPVIQLQQIGPNSYWSGPYGDDLLAVVAANPGADWIIGNEPDRRIFQNDMEPHVYALAYHDVYREIKQADPEAQIFAGAIVQPTPVRLRYLDMVLESYFEQFGEGMPVDGWAIHNFILNEASCRHYNNDLSVCWGADIPPGIDDVVDGLRIGTDDNDNMELFTEQIIRFRQWMNKRGYRDKPVYLSEYGVLMPSAFGFTQSRVNAYMDDTLDYLLNQTDPLLGDPTDGNRLVQRLAWYSTNDESFNGYLFTQDAPNSLFYLSGMGQNWENYAGALAEETDVYPVRITADPPAPLISGGNVTFTLSALIANSGNLLAEQEVVVRFYDANPAQGGVQIGADQTVSLAGCGDDATVSVEWPDQAPGNYQVYASVDPENELAETNEINNVTSRRVFFATEQAFVPLVGRAVMIP